jgi:hypothetical protein
MLWGINKVQSPIVHNDRIFSPLSAAGHLYRVCKNTATGAYVMASISPGIVNYNVAAAAVLLVASGRGAVASGGDSGFAAWY